MKKDALFHKDFTLMVLGQIMSLFGNAILRFSLSLYVLDTTGSAAVFGGILALSMIPTILLSPFGGMLADRVSRRNIMVALDYATATLIACFALFFLDRGGMAAIAVTMVLLSVIQSFYQPSVQSSIPALCSDACLERANGVVIQVNATANLLGPILGGFLYSLVGIHSILLGSGICFFLSACMELFLRIPFQRRPMEGGMLAAVKSDFSAAYRFLAFENPGLLKLLGIIMALNLFLSSMITVGLPYLIKITLGLSSRHYGFAEGALAAGSILAGCLAGRAARRMSFGSSHWLLLLSALAIFPMGLAVMSTRAPMTSYLVILGSVLACMCCASLYTIFAQTFIQRQTPVPLLGKVASLVTVICVCALPMGQALYGVLFDRVPGFVSLILFFSCAASLLVTMAAGKLQKAIAA